MQKFSYLDLGDEMKGVCEGTATQDRTEEEMQMRGPHGPSNKLPGSYVALTVDEGAEKVAGSLGKAAQIIARRQVTYDKPGSVDTEEAYRNAARREEGWFEPPSTAPKDEGSMESLASTAANALADSREVRTLGGIESGVITLDDTLSAEERGKRREQELIEDAVAVESMTNRLAARAAKEAIDACMKAQNPNLITNANEPSAKGKSPALGDVPNIGSLPVLQGTPQLTDVAEAT